MSAIAFEYQIAGRNPRPWWQFWVPSNVIFGEILASSRQQAIDLLRVRPNVTVYDVAPATSREAFLRRRLFRKPVSLTLIQGIISAYALYYVDGGMTEPDAIEAIARQAGVRAVPRVHEVLQTIVGLLRNSRVGTFGDACMLFPDVFPEYVGAIIAAGAQKGVLAELTADLEDQIEKRVQAQAFRQRVTRMIRNLMIPSLIMLGVFVFLFVPSMTSWYGADLSDTSKIPWFLLPAIWMARTLSNPVFLLAVAGSSIGAYIYWRLWVNTPRGKLRWDERVLKFGLYGRALGLMEQGDIFLTYSRLDNAGTETNEAWRLAIKTSGNAAIRAAFEEVLRRVRGGGVMLWQAFRDTKVIDVRAVDLMEAAEKAGGRNIPNRLEKLGRSFLREAFDLFQRAAERVGMRAAAFNTGFIIFTLVCAVFLAAASVISRH